MILSCDSDCSAIFDIAAERFGVENLSERSFVTILLVFLFHQLEQTKTKMMLLEALDQLLNIFHS